MGQTDVWHFLLDQKKKDPNRWFRVCDVQEALRKKGFGNGTIRGVSNDLLVLANFGDIKMRGIGAWKHYKEFQAK